MDANKPLAGLSVLVAAALVIGGGVASGAGVWYLQHRATKAADERAREAERRSASLEQRTLALESELASVSAALERAVKPAQEPAEPEPVENDEAPVKDEKRIAFVVDVVPAGDRWMVVADYAEMLTGKKAVEAHKADGLGELDGEEYYIRNINDAKRRIAVAENAKIVVWSWFVETEDVKAKDISFDEFKEGITGPDADERLRQMPYWLTISGQEIVRIEEQFIP